MDRRHAAQEAERHVEILAGQRRQTRDQWDLACPHVDEDPHSIALVQPARDLRDVGRRVAVAQKRLELRLAALGEDLAMAIIVEAIDHDPIVAGQVLEDAGRRVGERAKGRGCDDVVQAVLDLAARSTADPRARAR